MDQVASKCYLGLAIEEAVNQLGLQKKGKKIFDAYYESFMQHYSIFKQSYSDQARVQGKLEEHFQFPIGDKESLQYYLAYGEISLNVASIRGGRTGYAAMLEGFSTNEGNKGKPNKRPRKANTKGAADKGRKKKNS